MTLESAPVTAVHYAVATGAFHLTFLLVLLPTASAAVLLLGGKRTNSWGHLLGCGAPIAAFVIAVVEFFALIGRDGGQNRQLDQHLFNWQPVAGFHVNANLLLDPLSIVFVLLITGGATVVVLETEDEVARRGHDPDRRRFFGELNLFVAAMLLLVLADNYLVLYVGWEGVGLASYLLIGFWSHKPSAAAAAKKAFLVNRVGDLGLSLAIMLMFTTFGTVAFDGVFNGVGQKFQLIDQMRKFRRVDLGEFQFPLRQMVKNFFSHRRRDARRAVVDEFCDFGHDSNLVNAAPA